MDKFNCILYGESGVGKTPFCGTLQACEKTSPCLLLDVDMGTMSLDNVKPRPTVVPLETWSELESIFPLIVAKQWDKLSDYLTKIAKTDIPILEYKSVVIDSGTELEYRLRSSIVASDDRQEGIPDQPHYLKTQERFRRMYRKFRDLPSISLVVTAGIRELKDESGGIVKRYPDFQPSLCHDLLRMTDFIIFMSVHMEGIGREATWKRHLLASLSQRFVARSRSDKLPPIMEGDKFYWKDICEKILD